MESVPVIESSLLRRYPELRVGVSTRIGGVSSSPYELNVSYHVGDREDCVTENRRIFYHRLGIPENRVALPGQIHSDIIREAAQPGRYDNCDGLITASAGIFLGVTIADCVPVLLYDPVSRSIAAIHAGWKGSDRRIVSAAIHRLRSRYGVKPENLLAYIGPSAGVCCYEVGNEVAARFPGEFSIANHGSHPHLDLRGYNRSLLVSEGIRHENIEVSDKCTICSPDLLHSYRREGQHSGRMMAIIGMVSR